MNRKKISFILSYNLNLIIGWFLDVRVTSYGVESDTEVFKRTKLEIDEVAVGDIIQI